MKKYLVTEEKLKSPSRWAKFLSKIGLRRLKEPSGFEILINADFAAGEVIQVGEKTYYVIKQL